MNRNLPQNLSQITDPLKWIMYDFVRLVLICAFCTEMLHMTIAHEIINRTLSQILTTQGIKKIRKLEILKC